MIMISRNLRIALLISIGVHIVWMSVISIVTPNDAGRLRPYTRVDFLGSILKKTAFDMMIEEATPGMSAVYGYDAFFSTHDRYLDVVMPKLASGLPEFPVYAENSMEDLVSGFLTGDKAVPDFTRGSEGFGSGLYGFEQDVPGSITARKVIYRPEVPHLMSGLYDGKISFRVKMRVLVGPDGNVRMVESYTTTGYPRVDIMASEYVKGWIFERQGGFSAEDEWQEVNVTLRVDQGEGL